MTRFVPVLPDSAPFSPEQRAYLNGFLAGLFSHTPVPAAPSASSPPPAPTLQPLTILFGSQTGTAEKLAKRAAKESARAGFAPTLHDLAAVAPPQLASASRVLIITSTYGDGDPPDNARAFWSALQSNPPPRFDHLNFALCAIGDSNYPRFCQFGRDLDARLETLGARRVAPRQDCDVDAEAPFLSWLHRALADLGAHAGPGPAPAAAPSASLASPARSIDSGSIDDDPDPHAARWSKDRPFPASLKTNRRLSGPGSAKEVRHLEIAIGDSGISYQAGDALGVLPSNCPDLVDALLHTLGADANLPVPLPGGSNTGPLRQALLLHYEIARIPAALLQSFAEATQDPQLRRLTAPEANGELTAFLRGRDVLDLLEAFPQIRPQPADFVRLLRRLQPRLYSISSSPRSHPDEIHLTVNAVRYDARQRPRKGVASCFLADRCPPSTPVPIYLHSNPAFRPPAPDVPLIMIGPGTGIAPFRAFLQERRALGAQGRNWLFFGDQHAHADFLYQEEIEAFHRSGLLQRLDLAWSRDQDEKIYVQHRMLTAAADLWSWLQDGATVAVCGDASRMAKDVDTALREVITQAGALSPEAAANYLQHLQSSGRYLRDVY